MDIHDIEEVTEYFPTDPLADVPDNISKICVKDITRSDVDAKDIKRIKVDANLKCAIKRYKRKIRARFKSTTTNQSDIKCTICELTFPNRSSLSLHQKTHKMVVFECIICRKSFNRKSNLITHSRRHTNVKPFRCKYCSLSFSRTTELYKHAIFHTGDTRNQCKQCKLVLSSQESLEKHKKTHAVRANFQCQICGANGFQSKKSHTLHIRGVHETQICDTQTSSHYSNLTPATHIDKQLQCEVCKKQFSRRCNFMAHLKRHSKQNAPDKVKTHLCCICGKLFSYKTHLIRHSYIHANGRQ